MPDPAALPVFSLSIHARYGCRRALACCTSGWPIAVEPPIDAALREGLRRGWLRAATRSVTGLLPSVGLPGGPRTVLGTDDHGRCRFLEPALEDGCAVHRQLGADLLPASCRLFPRVCLLTPRGVSITLSHYCPTAAHLLFADDPLAIEEDPAAFPRNGRYEGLDARGALPPLLRPDVLMCWDSHARWERHAVDVFADRTWTPEDCLAQLREDAENARGWEPSRGPFAPFLDHLLAREKAPRPPGGRGGFAEALNLRRAAVQSVPRAFGIAPTVPDLAEADERWVRPTWLTFGEPMRRYLAAKAFASWCSVQGRGLRTTVRALDTALGVLRYEAARLCAAAARELDAGLLLDAIRASDLLLVHLVSPEVLADRLSVVERA